MRFTQVDEVQVDPQTARVYEHGWQSWSPTGLYAVTVTSPRPRLGWQHLMRFRPGVELPDEGFEAEGLLALDPGDGTAVRVYAATDPTREVPTVRARLRADRLEVWADGELVLTRVSGAIGEALSQYGDAEGERHRGAPLRPAPTAWCSWYQYFLDVSQEDIEENLEAIQRLDLPVGVVQVDDGWQRAVGDWLELSPRFTSLERLAERIAQRGHGPGIWVAPFMAGVTSDLAGEHPDWLHGDAGVNWEQPLRGLDLTHPGVRDYLWTVFRRLREAGFSYFKLDFLYSGALSGPRQEDLNEVEAYRSGLELVRDAVGDAAYILACGAPILPSLGLVDAMRVAPDTFNPIEPDDGANPLRGRAGVEARAWHQGRLWVNDGDCLVARPDFARRAEWAQVVQAYSGLRSFSDRIADLDDWGLETVRRLLDTGPGAAPFDHLPDPYRS